MKRRKRWIETLFALLASVLMSASTSGQERSKEKAAGKIPAVKADPAVIAKLIEQLGSDDFQKRENASRKLAELEEVPDALRQAVKNSDSEISRRAQAAIALITDRAEERALQAMLRDLNKIELDRFVRRMVMDIKFAGDKQWKVIQTVAKAVIDEANKSTGRRFQVPDCPGSQTLFGNPVRETLFRLYLTTSARKVRNGVSRTAFPNSVWERGEQSLGTRRHEDEEARGGHAAHWVTNPLLALRAGKEKYCSLA